MNLSPGIIATYWLLASLTGGILWCAACETVRYVARRRATR